MSPILVRPWQTEDRSQHVQMRVALWPEADPRELDEELDELMGTGETVIFVAERDDRTLCGFVEASVRPWADGIDERPCAFVEGWYVSEDRRRSGVGRALIEAVERWAVQRGFSELGSDTEVANVISQQAHLAVGFEERERVVHFGKHLG